MDTAWDFPSDDDKAEFVENTSFLGRCTASLVRDHDASDVERTSIVTFKETGDYEKMLESDSCDSGSGIADNDSSASVADDSDSDCDHSDSAFELFRGKAAGRMSDENKGMLSANHATASAQLRV